MTDISKALRERLKADAYIANAETERRYASRLDETVKYVFRLFDGELIETVLMKYEHGYTVCISTPGRMPNGLQILRLGHKRTYKKSHGFRNAGADNGGSA